MKKVCASRVVSKRPHWQLKLLSQAIAVVGAGMQASTVLAHPCPANPVHGAKTTTCVVADGETATINTGGSIIVSGGPPPLPPTATAIQIVGRGNKTVVNSGTLTGTTAAIQDQIPALSGGTINITNNAGGSISAETTSTALMDAALTPIYVNTQSTLNLTNNGTISARTSFSVYGVYMSGDQSGSIANGGTISATATSPLATAKAQGIYIRSMLASPGAVTNSGHIDVAATADSNFGTAWGIHVGCSTRCSGLMDSGSITNTNTGTITATAHGNVFPVHGAPVGGASARGIYLGENMASGSSITNAGTIIVHADAQGGGAAYGIYVSGTMASGSSITNDGTITTMLSGTSGQQSGAAAGIVVFSMDSNATITNNGTISANMNTGLKGGGAGMGYAIVVANGPCQNSSPLFDACVRDASEGGIAQVVNDASAVLNGNVLLDGVSLTNAGVLSIPVVRCRGSGFPPCFDEVTSGFASNGSFIGGNYTQSQSGLLTIGAYSLKEYGHLEVTGIADFTANGRLAVNVAPNDQLVAGGVLDNVVSAGTLITDTNLSVTDDSAAWDFTAVDDGAGGIDLKIAVHAVPLLAAQSVQVANVNLDELSSVVMGRMTTRRFLVEPGSHDQNLWLRSYGTTGSQDDDGDIPGYDIDSYGVVIGYDDNITEHWDAGAAFAYSNADIKTKGPLNDKIDTDFYQGAVYAYWHGSAHDYFDVMAIYGTNSNDSTREIGDGSSADGNYDGWYTRLSSAVGKGFPLSDSITFIPSASVSYTYVEEEGYDESGAGGANLNVDSNDASSLIFGLDGQIAFSMGQSALLTAHVGAGYDALTDDTSLTSSFVGGTPFTTEGNKPDEWLGRAGVGAEVIAGDRIEMHVNYEYEYRDTFTDNLLAATLRWNI